MVGGTRPALVSLGERVGVVPRGGLQILKQPLQEVHYLYAAVWYSVHWQLLSVGQSEILVIDLGIPSTGPDHPSSNQPVLQTELNCGMTTRELGVPKHLIQSQGTLLGPWSVQHAVRILGLHLIGVLSIQGHQHSRQ